jgi:hypothetical protein
MTENPKSPAAPAGVPTAQSSTVEIEEEGSGPPPVLHPSDRYSRWLAALEPETRERLSETELRAIWARAQEERQARRRRVPSWNADTDPPWRLLEHCFIAALKGCDGLSIRDLATVIVRGIARGKVWIIGTRDDVISDFLPDRIETLMASAELRYFDFENNSIRAIYSKPPNPLLHRLWIIFRNVRVHWPMLVEALQTAGFEIVAVSKQSKPRGGPPKQATQSGAIPGARPRGRPPSVQLDATVAKMKADLAERQLTSKTLNAKSPKDLAEEYGVSKYIALRARSKALK